MGQRGSPEPERREGVDVTVDVDGAPPGLRKQGRPRPLQQQLTLHARMLLCVDAAGESMNVTSEVVG